MLSEVRFLENQQFVVIFENLDCREEEDCGRDGLIIKTIEGYLGRCDASLPVPLSSCVIMLLQPSIFISLLLFCVSHFSSA